jgi:molybdate transport system ATP-binding protein
MIICVINKQLNSAQGKMTLEVALQIQKGSLSTVFGPSGAGKTTILRILAGLLNPDSGQIKANGETWLDTEKKINIPPQKRSIGIVFQDYALFPNMTVKENLTYALQKKQDKKIIDELTGIMELQQLIDRPSATLSGGQKQRVALARALIRRPQLMLLDEPLSALDHEMRSRLQDYILKAHNAYGLTTILVSHDISEIYKMSDNIFVLEHGKVTKQGTADEIFSNPQIGEKFQMAGEILAIEKADVIYIIRVLIYNNIVQIAATSEDIQHLKPGDQVIVSSKAFNPIIRKIER